MNPYILPTRVLSHQYMVKLKTFGPATLIRIIRENQKLTPKESKLFFGDTKHTRPMRIPRYVFLRPNATFVIIPEHLLDKCTEEL